MCCQGQNLEVDGKVCNDAVIIATYQVTIDKNWLLAWEDKIELIKEDNPALLNPTTVKPRAGLWPY